VQSNLAGASSSQHIGAWVFKILEFEEYIMYDNTDYDERRRGGGGESDANYTSINLHLCFPE